MTQLFQITNVLPETFKFEEIFYRDLLSKKQITVLKYMVTFMSTNVSE